MTRVLFITQTANIWGGVDVWLEYLTNALASRGWDVTVGLARGRRFHDPTAYRAAHTLPPTIEIPALTGTTEGRINAIIEAIEKTRADVVVPVNIIDAFEAVRRMKVRGREVRLFHPLHALWSTHFADAFVFAHAIDYAAATNRLAARALVEVSQLPSHRVAYAPCGVPAPLHEPTCESDKLRILFAGRITQPQKRARDLVPLAAELAKRGVDVNIDVAGDGDELPYLTEALANYANVRFAGLCSREELYTSFYPGLTAMLVLSDWETGPIVAWEAMRHGATIVTTDYLGLRSEQTLIHGRNALVAPVGDVKMLASHIESLRGDRAMSLRRAAYETALEHYTIERSIEMWEDALKACLAMEIALDVKGIAIPKVASRLDAIAGPRIGERIRAALGRGHLHDDPGGEWPHTWSENAADLASFADAVERLERDSRP